MIKYFVLSILLLLVSCNPASPERSDNSSDGASPRVLATVGMIGDIADRLAGDAAEVETLLGPSIDPHSYTPRRSDAVALSRANLVLYNGIHLEGRMADALSSPREGARSVAVAEEVLRRKGIESEDPHLWMDVALWRIAAQVIAEELITLVPAEEVAIRARLAELDEELATLDEMARTAIASIPQERRVLITAHDAFDWFGKAYGIEVIGVQGVSTISEPGLQDINRLVDRIVTDRIPAIFVETSVSDKNVMALVEGAKSRGFDVKIGGELFSDAMGAEGTEEGTYIGMITHNVMTIVEALKGSEQ